MWATALSSSILKPLSSVHRIVSSVIAEANLPEPLDDTDRESLSPVLTRPVDFIVTLDKFVKPDDIWLNAD
jgi:hypothetical protein